MFSDSDSTSGINTTANVYPIAILIHIRVLISIVTLLHRVTVLTTVPPCYPYSSFYLATFLCHFFLSSVTEMQHIGFIQIFKISQNKSPPPELTDCFLCICHIFKMFNSLCFADLTCSICRCHEQHAQF